MTVYIKSTRKTLITRVTVVCIYIIFTSINKMANDCVFIQTNSRYYKVNPVGESGIISDQCSTAKTEKCNLLLTYTPNSQLLSLSFLSIYLLYV